MDLGEISAGDGTGIGHDLLRRPLRNDLSAVDAGGRPHVDDPVGGLNRLLIMLHHQNRIAQVAKAAKRVEEPGVVALVQADARLVQNIEDADQ